MRNSECGMRKKSKNQFIVIPENLGSGSGAGPGIQSFQWLLDSGSLIGVRDKLRRNDGIGNFYEAIKVKKKI